MKKLTFIDEVESKCPGYIMIGDQIKFEVGQVPLKKKKLLGASDADSTKKCAS
jgi:hypothetical protein